jgi:hypothetical protein
MWLKIINNNFITVIFSCLLHFTIAAQTSVIENNYSAATGIKHLKIERSFIYVPDTLWMYSHHASVTHFKNKFIAVWSNGLVDEDKPGQRVVFATSTDLFHWSKPHILAEPSVYKNDTLNVLTAAGFYQFNDTLVAYFGEYSPYKTNTHLWAIISNDGEHWSDAIDMHIPVNPNHGPEKINNGRLLISGNFSFPYTDDYRGLSGWKMNSFYADSLYKEDNPATFYAPAEKNNLPPLCEGSFYETDDNVIHMLLRATGKGWKGKLWVAESKDNCAHWSSPAETNFTDNDSKFHFGRLPDKRFYYVGIPDTLHHYARTPLVISLSDDGKSFYKNYIIADEPYTLKKEGLWKSGQYGYPHALVYNGYMYVIVSREKEAIEIIRFNLNQLK